MANITMLPQECLSLIISLTSPRDACVLSVVSLTFKSIADTDAVWEKFLPSDYREVISHSETSSLSLLFLSKKKLYQHLCDNPVLVANGTMTCSTGWSVHRIEKHFGLECEICGFDFSDELSKSFKLDKQSGRKNFTTHARGLNVEWGDRGHYWGWKSMPHSRFCQSFCDRKRSLPYHMLL